MTLNLQNKDGVAETLRAQYLIACDGGNSYIRRNLGIAFEGETAPNQWIVIDLENDPLATPHIYLCCDPVRPMYRQHCHTVFDVLNLWSCQVKPRKN